MKFNHWPPALSFIVPQLPKTIGGQAILFVTLRLEKFVNDLGLEKHELEHVRQFWVVTLISAVLSLAVLYGMEWPLIHAINSLWVFDILYLVSPTLRLRWEVQAYKIQATYYAWDNLPLFAKFISTSYRLNITEANALKLLRS